MMKNIKNNKKAILILFVVMALFILSGCQRNTDANGITLPERIIYLTTPWRDMLDESFFTAIIIYPLAQIINFIGQYLGPVLGIILTAVLYNIVILPMSIKSTASTQKIQMLQPEMQKIQDKYAGKEDERSRMLMGQEMQALYSKYNINPLGSMIVPFLQFPFMIAMYYAVQRADAVVNGSFFGIPLSTTPMTAIQNIKEMWPLVVIFVLMAVSQFLSSKISQWLAEAKKKSDKNYRAYKDKPSQSQTQTNMMMYMMVGMVVLIGLRWPTAMSVYWLINSVINVLKTWYIQRRYVD